MRKALFIIVQIVSFLARAQAPELYFYSLNQEYGFPQNTIYSIIQGSKGDVYIAHSEGISRFNGKSFKQYNFKGKGKSLSNLHQLPDGTVLATSFYGDLIALKKDSIYQNAYSFREKSGRPVLKKLDNDFYVYEKNKIFKYHNDSLISLSNFKIDENCQVLDISEGEKPDQLMVMIQMEDTIGLRICNREGKLSSEFKLPMKISDNARFFDFKRQKFVFFIGLNKIMKVGKNGELMASEFQLKFNSSGVKLHSPTVLDSLHFALLSYDGMLIFNKEGELIRHCLKGYQVSCAVKDKEGDIIAGTLNDGVFIIPSIHITSLRLENILDRNDKVKKWIKANDSILFFGSHRGLVVALNLYNGNYKKLQLPRQAEIQSMYFDKTNGTLYAFCEILYRINVNSFKTEKEYHVTSTKDIIIYDSIIFCATSSHLIAIKNQKTELLFDQTWVNSLELDLKNHLLWLGTNKGLHYYDIRSRSCNNVAIDFLNKSNSTVAKVKQLPDADLLLHVINAGLIKGNLKSGFKFYKKDDAIVDFNIEDNYLFIQYKDHSSVVDLIQNKEIVKLDKSKCLEPSLITIFKHSTGLVALYPKQCIIYNLLPKANSLSPHLLLQNLAGSYRRLNDSSFVSDYDRNSLSFNLEILPNVRSRNTVSLKYKLVDVDMEWQQAAATNSEFYFKYQNLNSGNYEFMAKAINEDGAESELFVLKLEIKPPFWKTWWFILILGCIISFILLGLYLWRINYLKKQTILKLERQRNEIRLLSAELTTIRSQMNPHFIFNSLSSIQAKVINSKGDEALEDISRFSLLIRSVLDFSSREYIILKDEINFINNFLHLESGRYDSEMKYTVEVSDLIDVDFCEIPSLITIPLLENAIKHGLLHKEGEKKLMVKFTGDNKHIVVIVEDNGIGRNRSAEINKESRKNHKSFALEAMHKRIERINQTNKMTLSFNIEDMSEGTKAIITIKYHD